MTPFLLILSSPSGGGKTTIARTLLAARDDLGYSVSATTRSPRPGERDGVDYHYLTVEAFARREAAGEFLESAEYSGHRYATLRAEVERVLGENRHVVLDIEVQGARQIRARREDVVSIFILPPSAEALLERLGGRRSDRPEAVRRRLRQAVQEVGQALTYDYVVINDDRAQAVSEVATIIDAEARRTRRLPDLKHTIAQLTAELARLADGLSAP